MGVQQVPTTNFRYITEDLGFNQEIVLCLEAGNSKLLGKKKGLIYEFRLSNRLHFQMNPNCTKIRNLWHDYGKRRRLQLIFRP